MPILSHFVCSFLLSQDFFSFLICLNTWMPPQPLWFSLSKSLKLFLSLNSSVIPFIFFLLHYDIRKILPDFIAPDSRISGFSHYTSLLLSLLSLSTQPVAAGTLSVLKWQNVSSHKLYWPALDLGAEFKLEFGLQCNKMLSRGENVIFCWGLFLLLPASLCSLASEINLICECFLYYVIVLQFVSNFYKLHAATFSQLEEAFYCSDSFPFIVSAEKKGFYWNIGLFIFLCNDRRMLRM